MKRAILPAATGDLHHIGRASALCELARKDGDSVPGIRQIMVKESVFRANSEQNLAYRRGGAFTQNHVYSGKPRILGICARSYMQDSYSPLLRVFEYSAAAFLAALPRITGAAIVLFGGMIVAGALKQLILRVLSKLHLAQAFEKTPLEHFVKESNREQQLEKGVALICYWLIMLVVFETVASMLGLTPIALLLEQVLTILPHLLSAGVVLLIGVFFAGILENVAKAMMRSVSVRLSRAFGKATSYGVITVAILASLSELGIAREFILILFIGFVGSTALGVGLALGLGGQDVVRKMLLDWYKRIDTEIK